MTITPEILKEFVCESLSPEFLKNKIIHTYSIYGCPSIHITDSQNYTLPHYFVHLNSNILVLKRPLERFERVPIWCIHIPLSDPNASEKIKEFFEKDIT